MWFQRAYTTCPLCVPARTALATGVYPTRNGIVCNDWRGRTAGDPTNASALKRLHHLLRDWHKRHGDWVSYDTEAPSRPMACPELG